MMQLSADRSAAMRRRAFEPCAAPGRAGHARRTAPGRARASRRLRRVALLCGLAPPAAAEAASAECTIANTNTMSRPPAAAPGAHAATAAALQEREGLAARALSEMLCDERQAGRCRATVRQATASHPMPPCLGVWI